MTGSAGYRSNTDSDVEKVLKSSYEEARVLEQSTDKLVSDEITEIAGGDVLTRKELWAWYSYGAATEPYNTSVIGVYLSTSLGNMAAIRGYLLDHETPCDPEEPNFTCDYKWAGGWTDTNNYPLYIVTIASVIQVILYISLGTLADYSRYRKMMMLIFATIGFVSSIFFFAIRSEMSIDAASALYILSSIGYGCSLVFYNAYIPLLSRAHPRTIYRKLIDRHDVVYVPEFLYKNKLLKNRHIRRDEQKSVDEVMEVVNNKISAFGNLWMNLAAIIVLVIGLGTLLAMEDNQMRGMMIGCGVVGSWWLLFSIYPILSLKDRPGPPLPPGTNKWLFPFKSFKQTCVDVWNLPETLKFLIGWFFIADGMNTIMNVTALFANIVIGTPEDTLLIAMIIAPAASMIGAYGFSFIQERFNIRTRTLILVDVVLSVLLGVYVMIGFGTTAWGFNHTAELYPLIAYFGIINGGIIALSRAQFIDLCPPGMETEMFSLLRVTDKGSAFIGPLVSAGINSASRNLRFSYIWCLAVFLVSGIFFLWYNPNKGREEALAMAARKRDE